MAALPSLPSTSLSPTTDLESQHHQVQEEEPSQQQQPQQQQPHTLSSILIHSPGRSYAQDEDVGDFFSPSGAAPLGRVSTRLSTTQEHNPYPPSISSVLADSQNHASSSSQNAAWLPGWLPTLPGFLQQQSKDKGKAFIRQMSRDAAPTVAPGSDRGSLTRRKKKSSDKKGALAARLSRKSKNKNKRKSKKRRSSRSSKNSAFSSSSSDDSDSLVTIEDPTDHQAPQPSTSQQQHQTTASTSASSAAPTDERRTRPHLPTSGSSLLFRGRPRLRPIVDSLTPAPSPSGSLHRARRQGGPSPSAAAEAQHSGSSTPQDALTRTSTPTGTDKAAAPGLAGRATRALGLGSLLRSQLGSTTPASGRSAHAPDGLGEGDDQDDIELASVEEVVGRPTDRGGMDDSDMDMDLKDMYGPTSGDARARFAKSFQNEALSAPTSPDSFTRARAQIAPPIDPQTGEPALESDAAAGELGLPSLIAPEPTEATARVLEAARAAQRPGKPPLRGTRAAAARAVAEAAQISYQAAAQSGHVPASTALSAWQWPVPPALQVSTQLPPPTSAMIASPLTVLSPNAASTNPQVGLTSVLRTPSGFGGQNARLLSPVFAADAQNPPVSAAPGGVARLTFAPEQRRVRRKDLPPSFEVGDTYRGLDSYVLESRERRRAAREDKSKRRKRKRGSTSGGSSFRGSRSRSSSVGDAASTASGWSSSSSSSSSHSTDSTSSGEGHGLTIARLRAFFGDASSSSSSSSSSGSSDSDTTSSDSGDDVSGTMTSRLTDGSSSTSSSSSTRSSSSGRSGRSGFSLSLARVRSNISGRRRRISISGRAANLGVHAGNSSASILSGAAGSRGDAAGRTPRLYPFNAADSSAQNRNNQRMQAREKESRRHRRHRRQQRQKRELQRRRRRAARKQMTKFESSARKAGLLPPKPSKSARNKARLAKQLAGGVTEWTLYTPVPLPVSTTRKGLRRREGDSQWNHEDSDASRVRVGGFQSDDGHLSGGATTRQFPARPVLKHAATAQAILHQAETPPGKGIGTPPYHHHPHHHHHHRHGSSTHLATGVESDPSEPKEQVLQTISFLAVKDRLYALRHHIRQREHMGGDLGMMSSSMLLEDPNRPRAKDETVAGTSKEDHGAREVDTTVKAETTVRILEPGSSDITGGSSGVHSKKFVHPALRVITQRDPTPVSLPRGPSFPSTLSAALTEEAEDERPDPVESSVMDIGGAGVLLDPSPGPPTTGTGLRRRAASSTRSEVLDLEDGDLALPPPALELEESDAASRAADGSRYSGSKPSSSPQAGRSRALSTGSKTFSRSRTHSQAYLAGNEELADVGYDPVAQEKRTGWHMSDVPLTPLIWRRQSVKFWSAFERAQRERKRSNEPNTEVDASNNSIGVTVRKRSDTVAEGLSSTRADRDRSRPGTGSNPPMSALEELRHRRLAPMGLEERLRAGVEMGRQGSQEATRQDSLRPGLALGVSTPLRSPLARSPFSEPFSDSPIEMKEFPPPGQVPISTVPGTGKTFFDDPEPMESSKLDALRGDATPHDDDDVDARSETSQAYQAATPPSSGDGTRSSTRPTGAWWLDVKCPTYSDMKDLSKMFPLHPLTVEDILQQDPREKVEVFEKLGYYFVTVRAIDETYFRIGKGDVGPDGDAKGPRIDLLSGVPGKDGIEGVSVGAINLYLVVFSHGLITFHFEDLSKHTTRVLKRLMDLSQSFDFTADWIAHGLMDSLVDAFFPLMNLVESEVAEFEDHLHPSAEHSDRRTRAWVNLFSGKRHQQPEKAKRPGLALTTGDPSPEAAVQSALLKRMATVRKIVTGLMRLLSPKSEGVVSLRKRYMELSAMRSEMNRTEVSIHMGDLHDHIITLITGLHHCDDRLTDTHADYLSVVQIRNRESRQRADRTLVGLVTVTLTAVTCTFFTSFWSFNVQIPMNVHGSPDHLLFLIIIAVMGVITLSLQLYVKWAWRNAKQKRLARSAHR
ncbi:hypothetical protein OC846_003558 [Tilletia horrida]|uniref:Uncharacterized protein n=1 Tax=Tilletia horrida TaxID=155126 RepID=A0AAN6JR78_9BASI|nr:hypothetical protein OC845_003830 [Tilletia horrida]KAK0550701.1 hypothetical protein OC846_003558 [Tilletia horrida]